MYYLSQIIVSLFLFTLVVNAQSPHGSGFSMDCSNCHKSTAWNELKPDLAFNHAATKFTLTGQHQAVNCKQCHSTLVFNQADENCFSCHKDVHAGTVSKECSSCHTTNSWLVQDIQQIHRMTRFPLLGEHQNAACADCHSGFSSLKFDVSGVECFICHAQDYNGTQNPNHRAAGISTDCFECHSVESRTWNAQNFSHEFFPLQGGHNLPSCFSCHTNSQFTGLQSNCVSCHLSNYNAAANPNHVSANFGTDCKVCHSINGWRPAAFDHNLTAFPLTGRHTAVDCASCHTTGYTNTPSDCNSCHNDNYLATTNPNHVASGFPVMCNDCHTTQGWLPAQFDHDNLYFPIYSGKHRNEWNACTDCHTTAGNYAVFSCITCHEHNKNSMDSEHQGISGYIYTSEACLGCHPNGESDGAFNHGTSQFPLTGAHTAANCADCHKTGFTQAPTTSCAECHANTVNQVNNPNHQNAGFNGECTECHTTDLWKPSNFNHTTTGFSLTGAHINNDCNSCHATGYATLQQTCITCHQSDVNNTLNPNHQSAGFAQLCENCHTTSVWKPANYDHSTTGFVLAGAHMNKDCNSCHSAGYTTTSSTCVSCHQSDYTGTTNPNHNAAAFPQQCETCHTSTAWTPATFEHDAQYFPIYSGKHRNEWDACSDCHTNGSNLAVFSCITCHEHNQNSMNQEHQGVSGYIYASSECFACHPDGSGDGAFNHATSSFPLSGAHITATCNSCHSSGYANTSSECSVCHGEAYIAAQNPNHQSAGIPQTCNTCHNAAAWIPSTFEHSTTPFALTGAHQNAQCMDCHTGNLTSAVSTCNSCHQSDYTSATNPNHTALQLSSDCNTCHTTNTGWQPALFPVHNDFFALVGRHSQIQNNCSDCHNGNYTTTPNTCYDCHQSDYNTANQPNHAAPGFPHECESCHGQSVWSPSTFNHDAQYFPVYSGKHRNEWNTCSQCHPNESNFAVFTCISCHEHNQTSMNQEHQGVNNYLYNSAACLNCHPDGDDLILRHKSKTDF